MCGGVGGDDVDDNDDCVAAGRSDDDDDDVWLSAGLVVYMISGSYNAVLEIGLWESYFLSVGPVFLYILLCLKAKTETQINVAAVMSAVYAIVMLLVLSLIHI